MESQTEFDTDLNNNVQIDSKPRGRKDPLYFTPQSSSVERKKYKTNLTGRRRSKEYEVSPSDSTWSSRLRIRKRKLSASSSADESVSQDTPIAIMPASTPATSTTPTTANTTIAPKALSTTKRTTDSPSTPSVSKSKRNSTKNVTPSNTNGEDPSEISQEYRDMQRIVSVIKSFLPHPGCFLVEDGILECFVCGEVFRYRDNWRRHLLEQHFHLTFQCQTCGQKFKRRGKCSEHMLRCRKNNKA